MSEPPFRPRYYTLGLDLGIASVGWSVVEIQFDKNGKYFPKRLVDFGVRLFDRAENPKNGESLNSMRRVARSTRRRLRRRKYRLLQLRHLLLACGLISHSSELEQSFPSPWELRTRALDVLVSDQELARIIYHIVKHRGFASNRRGPDRESETSSYKEAIKENLALLNKKKYRSVGEMIYRDKKFEFQKRNKQGNYLAMLTRDGLRAELELILDQQQELGNSKVDSALKQKIIDLFVRQRPFSSGDDILSKVGECTLIIGKRRAPKHAPTFEKFRAWQILNNIRISNTENGTERELTASEKLLLWETALSTKTPISFLKARKLIQLSDADLFSGVRYEGSLENKDIKNVEKRTLISLHSYHTLLSHLCPDTRASMKDNFPTLDSIVNTLTLYKTEEEVRDQLRLISGLTERDIEKLVEISFTGFCHLSLEALSQLLPWLIEGYSYDQAVASAGLKRENNNQLKKNTYKLPPIDPDEISNPVVLRAISQARKVVNAIIDRYGQPSFIHIELARDLSRSFTERRKIEKLQEEGRRSNEELNTRLINEHQVTPNAKNRLLLRLWLEQSEKCAYSQKHIPPEQLFASNTVQIEHVLPRSRSLDDSYMNKVLVYTQQNQNKGNLTAWEFFGASPSSPKWLRFQAFVLSSPMWPRKKINLLTRQLPENIDEILQRFSQKNLNDTRYITSYFASLLSNSLAFPEIPSHIKRRVYSFNGQFTHVLRWHWNISKNRQENDRHHAVDAIVVACSSQGMIEKITKFFRARELGDTGQHLTSLIEPWEGFREEIRLRVFSDSYSDLLTNKEICTRYADCLECLKPLFVSRAQNKKITGAAHKATLYSGNEYNRTKKLTVHSSDSRLGSTSPIPRKRKEDKANIVVPLNQGRAVAVNDSMIRVDVFTKNGKHYLVPIYVADTVKPMLPNKAIVAGRQYDYWEEIDDSYTFAMSIYPKDYIVCQKNDKVIEGYYMSCHSGTGSMRLSTHDNSKPPADIGARLLDSITKYQIGVLGDRHAVKGEKRLGFSKRHHTP